MELKLAQVDYCFVHFEITMPKAFIPVSEPGHNTAISLQQSDELLLYTGILISLQLS